MTEIVAVVALFLFGIHYSIVVWLVFEAITRYHLDRYTPYAVWSLVLWFPIIYAIHRYA